MCIPAEYDPIPKMKNIKHQMLKAKRDILEQ